MCASTDLLRLLLRFQILYLQLQSKHCLFFCCCCRRLRFVYLLYSFYIPTVIILSCVHIRVIRIQFETAKKKNFFFLFKPIGSMSSRTDKLFPTLFMFKRVSRVTKQTWYTEDKATKQPIL